MAIILLNFIATPTNILFSRFQLSKILHNPQLEFIWTIMPTIILINMALPTFTLLYSMDLILDPKSNIKVIGNQWYWGYETSDFYYTPTSFAFDSFMIPIEQLSEGERRLFEVDNFLILPAKSEFRLLITAKDVLHSWALPSFGIKLDAVPGRLNANGLNTRVPGLYFGQCSELCGPNHGFMPIVLHVIYK
jgi:cytochrome c oxidase subunit 2